CIVLPQTTDTDDLLDGLLFETFNAKATLDYDVLKKEFMESLKPISTGKTTGRFKVGVQPNANDPTTLPSNPISLADFGRRRAKIEAEVTVLKTCQSLFALKQAGNEPAYQGQRNLDGIGCSVLRAKLKGKEGATDPETEELRRTLKYLEALLAVDPKVG